MKPCFPSAVSGKETHLALWIPRKIFREILVLFMFGSMNKLKLGRCVDLPLRI